MASETATTPHATHTPHMQPTHKQPLQQPSPQPSSQRGAHAANEKRNTVRDYLLNRQNAPQYRHLMTQGLDLITHHLGASRKPYSGIKPHELSLHFHGVNLDHPPLTFSEALDEIQTLYLNDAVYFHHPTYAAHLNCPIVTPAVVGDMIASSINTAVETWDQSAGATFIEQKLVNWMIEKIGLGPTGDGVFTSGGTQSNLMGLLLARDAFCAQRGHDVKHQGLPEDFKKLRILTSEVSHFSVKKAASILGLGQEAIISLPTDRHFRMDIHALKATLARCQQDDLLPMAIVATAGATDFGSIDPLPHIAKLCAQHRLWLHVDAAYGCGLLVSPRHRHLLNGIEHADSVTVDFHKAFFQPVSCSTLLVRNRQHLSAVTYHADYLNPLCPQTDSDHQPNLVDKSLQTTRRFDALKLWLTLRTIGAHNIGLAFDRVMHLARQVHLACLADPHIDVIHQPQISTLVFRYLPSHDHPAKTIDQINKDIHKQLYRSGEGLAAMTRVKGRQYLKFTLLNPAATTQNIRTILNQIKQCGKNFTERND